MKDLSSLPIDSCKVAYLHLKNEINPEQEEVWILGLSSSKHVLIKKKLFMGTADACLYHPRDLFKAIFISNSTAFILAHNHPSNSLTPSEIDIKITEKVLELSLLHQVDFVDHLIIGKNGFYSFANNNLII